jgi:prepilin-type N-terminal cleavage/methylation domain-containing protein
MNVRKGFTLIELLAVIVVLAILIVMAVPRYIDLQAKTRVASLNGLANAFNAAVVAVRGSWNAQNRPAGGSVMLDTLSVSTTATGYPRALATGIGAVVDVSAFTVVYTAPTATFAIPSTTNCFVTYTETTGSSAVTSSGC